MDRVKENEAKMETSTFNLYRIDIYRARGSGGITQFALRDLSLPESERSCKAVRMLQSGTSSKQAFCVRLEKREMSFIIEYEI